MVINGYELKSDLKNDNSGFSKWGFATKDGKEVFIKELISPVYPIDETIMSQELIEKQRSECIAFEKRLGLLFDTINNASKGNLVRIESFFRWNSRYYIVNEKITGNVGMEEIVKLSEAQKILLLKTVAYAISCLHNAGIVHCDIKPSNIMVRRNDCGNYVAKVIDFDSGFTIGELGEAKEVGGDFTYLAPEILKKLCGEEVQLNEKLDIFSLGILFHEYFCGKTPLFNEEDFNYPSEAILNGFPLIMSEVGIPTEIKKLIIKMTDVNPLNRPSAKEILLELNRISGVDIPVEIEKEPLTDTNVAGGSWFKPAGDL